MNTFVPGSATVFGPDLGLTRCQISGLEERPFDLGQRILFVRRIEIVDKVAAHFGNRRAI
jgi:hypothetical protein